MNNINIRKIETIDNPIIAKIIRKVLTEFGGNRRGTAYYDYDTDHMFEAYQNAGEIYYVVELNGKVVGGCGIKQLLGADKAQTRGLGIGKILVDECLRFAKDAGYNKCYLETFPNMHAAISLYKKFEFKNLDAPLGSTGHGACDVWLMRNL